MERVIVLGHAKPWSMKNDVTGATMTGVKVSYVSESPATGLDGARGYLPIQVNLDPMVLNDLVKVPAVYEIGYGMKPGKNNKPEMIVSYLKFIKESNFENLFK